MSRDTKSHAVVSNASPSMACFKSAVVHPVVATMWAGAKLSPCWSAGRNASTNWLGQRAEGVTASPMV